jgi:hypothetical protein
MLIQLHTHSFFYIQTGCVCVSVSMCRNWWGSGDVRLLHLIGATQCRTTKKELPLCSNRLPYRWWITYLIKKKKRFIHYWQYEDNSNKSSTLYYYFYWYKLSKVISKQCLGYISFKLEVRSLEQIDCRMFETWIITKISKEKKIYNEHW